MRIVRKSDSRTSGFVADYDKVLYLNDNCVAATTMRRSPHVSCDIVNMDIEIHANDTVMQLKSTTPQGSRGCWLIVYIQLHLPHAVFLPLEPHYIGAAYSSSANVSGLKLSRLYKRRRRLWADDIWALFASVALVIQVVAIFLHVMLPVALPVNSLTNEAQIPPPNSLSYTTRIAGAARQLLIPLLG
jgi:hypothetical protein